VHNTQLIHVIVIYKDDLQKRPGFKPSKYYKYINSQIYNPFVTTRLNTYGWSNVDRIIVLNKREDPDQDSEQIILIGAERPKLLRILRIRNNAYFR
jgi:hypothetical protein